MTDCRELVQRIKTYNACVDEEFITRAFCFAKSAHGHQKRASGAPYFSHPLEVAKILADLKLDVVTVATGLLHDTVEDTGVTLDEIQRLFGVEVAFLVSGVTKFKHITKPVCARGHYAEDFLKLLRAMSTDIRVLLVKLADRLHNMQTLHHLSNPQKRHRIAQETMNLYVPLADRIGMRPMKEMLQDLAFSHLNKDAHDAILKKLSSILERPKDLIASIVLALRQLFHGTDLTVTVWGRAKNPYSIWEKMQRKHVLFEKIADIFAFRILVDTVADCYRVLGILHTSYCVIPGRFKDYISTPKKNHYRALHTTLVGPFQKQIEIQIYTKQMLYAAEHALAAHWHYKHQHQKNGHAYKWVHDLLDILEHALNAEEFFEHFRLELFQETIFCFTPKGDVLHLPKGATPVDFAYAVHSQVGSRCSGALINGALMPVNTVLVDGDQVEILVQETQKPSPLWENFVVTGRARSKIRCFMRNQQ